MWGFGLDATKAKPKGDQMLNTLASVIDMFF
jgi:hypothetical protein